MTWEEEKIDELEEWERNNQFFFEIQDILTKMENILYGKEQIKSSDENAIEKLTEKLENLRHKQDKMKAVNAYYNKKKTLDGCSELTEKEIEQLKEEMNSQWHLEDKPFASFTLSNNNQNIHSVEKRIKRLKVAKEEGNQETEYEFFRVVENIECMRLQLFFNGKPEFEVREILKENGFRWAPSQSAWQRQLTKNAKYALKRLIEQLRTIQED